VKNIFISDKLAEVGINKQSAGSPVSESLTDALLQQLCAFSPVHKSIQINL